MSLVSKKSLGINFASNPPTFVELRKTLGRINFVKSGSLAASADSASSGNLPSLAKADEVIVGLPQRCFVLRFLEFPDLNTAELDGLIAYELDRHLPFSPEKALYGFQKVTRRQGKAQVMLVAAKREDVEGYLAQAERAGFRPTGVAISATSVMNVFLFYNRRSSAGGCCLIAVNGKEAGISVVRDGALLSSRSVFLNNGSFDTIIAELNRIAAVCPEGARKVFVTGDSHGLALRLKETLGIQPDEWSPDWSPADASAYGLALGGLAKLPVSVNLLPPERRKKKREKALTILVALLCLGGILGASLIINSAVKERQMLNWLDDRLAKIKAESAVIAALRRETTQLEHKLRVFNGLLEKQERPLLALKELTQLFPPGVSLNEFSIQDDKVRVGGSTSSSASELISVLERSSVLENASFVSPISSQAKDRQGFQIQASIKTRYPTAGQVSKTTGAKTRK